MPPKQKAKIVKDVTQLVLARRTRMCNFLEYKGEPGFSFQYQFYMGWGRFESCISPLCLVVLRLWHRVGRQWAGDIGDHPPLRRSSGPIFWKCKDPSRCLSVWVYLMYAPSQVCELDLWEQTHYWCPELTTPLGSSISRKHTQCVFQPFVLLFPPWRVLLDFGWAHYSRGTAGVIQKVCLKSGGFPYPLRPNITSSLLSTNTRLHNLTA